MKNILNYSIANFCLTHFLSILLIGVILVTSNLSAQFDLNPEFQINVTQDGSTLSYPWAGGLNAPQFSQFDLNNDGLEDLFVFERVSNKILIFINQNTGEPNYEFSPNIAAQFPVLRGWALIRDFNCDGVPDIFTGRKHEGKEGIALYSGTYSGSSLSFSLISPQLTKEDNYPIGVALTDIPAVDDIDGDGDLDILTFQELIGGFVEYYNNGSGCEEPAFTLEDECWGKFYERGIYKSVKLDTTCDGSGFKPLDDRDNEVHPGSTLLTLDMDNDGDKELVLGDISFDNLVHLTNGGTPTDAFITAQDTIFPYYDVHTEIQSYPAAFGVDVNNDGLTDILTSPNSAALHEAIDCVWYYENTGSAENPNYNFTQSDYLVEDMIDVGRFAQPTFFDYNSDGLIDLIVGGAGHASSTEEPTGLFLYENTGTNDTPSYQLITDDYMGLKGMLGLVAPLRPAFGDLNGDGAADMLLGIGDTEFNGQVIYFENSSAPGELPMYNFSATGLQVFEDVGQNSSPQIVDVDRDGKNDVLIGQKNVGFIVYYRNITENGNVEFELINEQWGNVDLRTDGQPDGYSAPFLTELDEEDKWYLITGSRDGRLFIYEGIEDSIETGSFSLLGAKEVGQGERTCPTLAQLDNDPEMEIAIGTATGGIALYEITALHAVANDNITTQISLEIYPNPSSDQLFIDCPIDESAANIRVFDLSGKQWINANWTTQQAINVKNLESGVYFLQILTKGQTITRKFVVQ